jgi:hypothetical protein
MKTHLRFALVAGVLAALSTPVFAAIERTVERTFTAGAPGTLYVETHAGSTSGGRVTAEGIAVAPDGSRAGRSRLAGVVNGGGPVLKLRSSGGNIDIQAR